MSVCVREHMCRLFANGREGGCRQWDNKAEL